MQFGSPSAREPAAASSSSSGHVEQQHPRKTMATILIVDERAGNREYLTTLLANANHQLVEAGDGAEGLARAKETHPDLIITDILMPAMDGYEFIRQLRVNPELVSTPVIFYSANYLLQEARALAAKCGVEYVLLKAGDPEEVLRTVDLALGSQPVSAAVPPAEFDREQVRVLTGKLSQKAGELQTQNARLAALVELGHEMGAPDNPERLVETYCDGARRILGATRAVVVILDEPPAGPARYIRASGFGAEDAEHVRDSIDRDGESVFAEAWRRRECRRGSNPGGNPFTLQCTVEQPPIYSYLAVPILWRNQTFGWMGFANKIGYEEFTEEDERLAIMLAEQLAVAYENSRLFGELKRRAEQLEGEAAERRKSAEKYQMVLEQASDGIAIADDNGHYLEVNPRLLEMLRYTRSQFLALHMSGLIPPEDLERDPIAFDPLREGKIVRKEYRFVRGDGSRLEVEVSMSRLLDGRVQSIVRDVAERKNLERQLHQSQKLEAVGRLAGGVAHDFNNLLTVILGHSDLALAGLNESDRHWRDIHNIREAGARAAVLTTQLLAFSRKQILQPKVLSINTSVSNLTKMLGRLISSNIQILTKLDPALWETRVDPTQLDQVILNLVINAKDAMPLGGQLLLETANQPVGRASTDHQDVPGGDYVTLAISDTGCGMDAETLSHLFEPFFTTKGMGKGTGLGLSTVYGIVQQSCGHIRVTSEPGVGSIFKIYLPRATSGGERLAESTETEMLPYGTETVLVAEDEERVRSLTTIVLRQQGYKVLEAGDGQEALRIAVEYAGEIHLLFTDMMMPRMSGIEVAGAVLRRRPEIK